MGTTGPSLTRYFFIMLLHQMTTPSSEHFTVTGVQGPVLAPLSGVVELSCQLSPPQSAEHMEIRWFRDRYTQPVHLFVNGKDRYGEITPRYVERTELLKEAIREGKVTLKIFNVSVDDDGHYHCFFQDGDFYEEAITEVKVTAESLETQILVHPPSTRGLLVECNSAGWFPQPQMEWRDSRGEIIPPTSISHSQDTDKLFNMKMALLLTHSLQGKITCCLRNSVTGQEERTSIVLTDVSFPWKAWILTLLGILFLLLTLILVPSFNLHCRLSEPQSEEGCCSQSSACSRICTEDCLRINRFTGCCHLMKSPICVGILISFSSLGLITVLIIYLRFKSRAQNSSYAKVARLGVVCSEPFQCESVNIPCQGGKPQSKWKVPASDPHFQMDAMWLDDMTVILSVLIAFITMIISFIYFRFRGFLEEERIQQALNISSGILDEDTVEQ